LLCCLQFLRGLLPSNDGEGRQTQVAKKFLNAATHPTEIGQA
jgi:hypothetical protein